ncbi:hypothetical protein [Nitratireductor luteus]|uniref:hypothetical protein n=1 Tax=Nitratireductor luteus TaxID=2976980 RepID=UPI00223F41FC|nr:hypothetical protein [Nitratireductor luteus]
MKTSAIWLTSLIACGSPPAIAHGSDLADHEVNVQEVIAALEANDMSANEIRTAESYVRLNVVDLSAFKSSDEYQALEEALSRTDDSWAMVQTAIVGNESIMQELSRRSVEVRNVVAATMDGEGLITIYTR